MHQYKRDRYSWLSQDDSAICQLFFVTVIAIVLTACVRTETTSSPTIAPTPVVVVPGALLYDELVRNVEPYKGKNSQLRGEVIEVTEVTGQSVDLLIRPMDAVDGGTVIVHYVGSNVHVGDMVLMIYTVEGSTTYTTESGEKLTVPELTAIHLSVE